MIHRRSASFPARWHPAGAFFGYLLAVVILHWDVITHLGEKILAGNFVGGIFIWEFHWFKKCLIQGINPFFTTDLMFPVGTPIVIESPWNIGLSLVLQLFTDPYRALNLLFLVNYVGAGFAMYVLAHELTEDARASFLAGFVFMFSQYNIAQHILGHLHECTLMFLPLIFLGLLRMMRGERKGWGLFALGSVGTCLSSTYLTFEVLLIGVPAFALLARNQLQARRRDFALKALAVYALAGALGLSCYLPVLIHNKELIGGSAPYSLSLLSFLDMPAWHPAAWVQNFRAMTGGADAEPEHQIGYFGITLAALLTAGARPGLFKNHRAWLGLASIGIVLSLGSHLQIAYAGGSTPLPYLVFQGLPYFSSFRAPSRMIVLAWLGFSVLAAISFAGLTKSSHRLVKASALSLFLLCYSWEMGLHVIGRQWNPLQTGGAYRLLAQDKQPGAVLELPASIGPTGGISVSAERFMLHEPLHGRPLVLGRPVRYTARSLDFCRRTPFIYELTHPYTLPLLYSEPKAAGLLREIKKRGAGLLKSAGIKYVLFHANDRVFSPESRKDYAKVLSDALGEPTVNEAGGLSLYKVF